MKEALTWWWAAFLGGAMAFPIAFAFFRRLPDKGYPFAKVIGLLLLGYALWIAGSVGLLPNARGSILLLFLLLALVGSAFAFRYRQEIWQFLREHGLYVLWIEALFAAAFIIALFLRSYSPDIFLVEDPKDFSFLNAVVRTDELPPPDPFLSGHDVNYYYFGYVQMGLITKVTGVAPSLAYNLSLGLVAALSVTAGFGLMYNLAARGGWRGAVNVKAIGIGLVGVLFLLILSNSEGLFEILAAHGLGSAGFYDWLHIAGLDGPRDTTTWYPTEHHWWFRAIGFFNWTEFPFFSFLLGNLHPHLLAIPFMLLAFALAWNLWQGDGGPLRAFWRHPFHLLFTGLAIGGLGFLNAWSLPIALFFLLAVAFLKSYHLEGGLHPLALAKTAAYGAAVTGVSFLLYAPFFLATEFPVDPFPATGPAVRPIHLFIMWGLFLVLAFLLAVFAIARHPQRWRFSPAQVAAAAVVAVSPLLAWLITGNWVTRINPPSPSFEWQGWWTVFLLTSLFFLLLLAVLRRFPVDDQDEHALPLLFSLAAAAVGVLILLGAELFIIQDPLGQRGNTILKSWYQAWLLLGISSAFGAYWIAQAWRPRWELSWLASHSWAIVVVGLCLSGLVYPVTATFARADESVGPRTLNGEAWMARDRPAQYEALQWIRNNIEGTPVILEASCCDWAEFGQVSARTGLPTVLGRPTHEFAVRGDWELADPNGERITDVKRAYTTLSIPVAQAILDKYDVQYVYVGRAEKEFYGSEGVPPPGLDKFLEFMDVVFENDEVAIYKVRTPP